MYSGVLRKEPFQPDPSAFRHAGEREEYARKLRESSLSSPQEKGSSSVREPEKGAFSASQEKTKSASEHKNLAQLLEMISPEDSALIALIVFLLCDNTENDVVLLGILLYVLLSK